MAKVTYVKQGVWIEIKKEIWADSLAGQPVCGYCQEAGATELDHALYPKAQLNYKKYKKWMDSKLNAVPVCKGCHDNKPPGARSRAYLWLCRKYGYETMKKFRDSIPMRQEDWI